MIKCLYNLRLMEREKVATWLLESRRWRAWRRPPKTCAQEERQPSLGKHAHGEGFRYDEEDFLSTFPAKGQEDHLRRDRVLRTGARGRAKDRTWNRPHSRRDEGLKPQASGGFHKGVPPNPSKARDNYPSRAWKSRGVLQRVWNRASFRCAILSSVWRQADFKWALANLQ